MQISSTFKLLIFLYHPVDDGQVIREDPIPPTIAFNTVLGGTLLQERGNDVGA